MLVKRFCLVFLLIFIHFSQLALGKDADKVVVHPGCPKMWKGSTYLINCSLSWEEWYTNGQRLCCCEGYIMNDKNECYKDCKHFCKHGLCDNQNECVCKIGFGGNWCDKACPAGHFGSECEHNCECLTSKKCNPIYDQCKCNTDEITAECLPTCKCRSNFCSPGLFGDGKNCTTPCPDGTYGLACSKTCSCVAENTMECVKETGYCLCKDSFSGKHCENTCTGIVHCDEANICTCVSMSLAEKLQLLTGTKELLIGLVCSVALFISLAFLVFRYKIKSRQLKNEVKIYSLGYSTEQGKAVFFNPIYSSTPLNDCTSPLTKTSDVGKAAFNNPIYANNMLEDCAAPLAKPSEQTKSFLEALKSNSLFNKMSSNSKDWLKLKTGKQADAEKPTNDDEENKVDEHIYSTICDLNDVNSHETKSDDPAV